MKSAEAFIKTKFPDAYAAYQQYKKDEKVKEKAAEKKRKEKEMKNRKDFEDYPLYYYYDTSYGWSEGDKEGSISLKDAFEKVENASIDPAGFGGGMTFKEYLDHCSFETEAHFFKRWFGILKGTSEDLAEEISNCDYRVTQNPVHEGIRLFTNDEVKAFFRNAKYKEK